MYWFAQYSLDALFPILASSARRGWVAGKGCKKDAAKRGSLLAQQEKRASREWSAGSVSGQQSKKMRDTRSATSHLTQMDGAFCKFLRQKCLREGTYLIDF
jgi:hypothetical protein